MSVVLELEFFQRGKVRHWGWYCIICIVVIVSLILFVFFFILWLFEIFFSGTAALSNDWFFRQGLHKIKGEVGRLEIFILEELFMMIEEFYAS